MGEEVSKRWAKEEEQAFHEVVFSNPASMGRIFGTISHWFDPHNVDSDNDEWQISEHEAGMAEEDEDSGVESPTNQDAPACQEDHAKDCQDDIEDEGDVDDIFVQYVKNSVGDSGGNTDLHLLSKIQSSYREGDDVQDDSCTSYEFEQIESCDPLYTGTDQKQSDED
ncbi:hypothetical protein Pint_19109 [Pistacia integerrima]|uniref:Uncharacterized protein n=1 Tax=Pistacia integerrima TaxID=434235 RepID=A0ACC0YWQ7_9ROSI|nr:hypothetical protein Pint_19109 [Pistacia integerrima]